MSGELLHHVPGLDCRGRLAFGAVCASRTSARHTTETPLVWTRLPPPAVRGLARHTIEKVCTVAEVRVATAAFAAIVQDPKDTLATSLRNHRRLVSTRSGRLESVDPAAGGGNGADRRSTVVCCTEPKDRPELICPSGEMRRRHPQGQRTDPKVQSRQRLRARPPHGGQPEQAADDRPTRRRQLPGLARRDDTASVSGASCSSNSGVLLPPGRRQAFTHRRRRSLPMLACSQHLLIYAALLILHRHA